MDLERLKGLVRVVGKERLILDLSCRKKVPANIKMNVHLCLDLEGVCACIQFYFL